jgi:hypothetical protein
VDLVEAVDAEAGELAGPHARVNQETDDRTVAAILERVALARRQQGGELIVRQDWHGLLRHGRRSHPVHR